MPRYLFKELTTSVPRRNELAEEAKKLSAKALF
jgi:hypothetical protein